MAQALQAVPPFGGSAQGLPWGRVVAGRTVANLTPDDAGRRVLVNSAVVGVLESTPHPAVYSHWLLKETHRNSGWSFQVLYLDDVVEEVL